MMDILCLMGLFPKEYEATILENSIVGVQNAANKFQWGIVNGLDGIEDAHFKIVNSLYIGSYPKRYTELKIPSFQFSHSGNAKDINVGFTNLTILKNFSRYIGIKKQVDKWAKEKREDKKVLMAYAMTSPFVEILNYVKRKYPHITCCLVVPDLPEYMNASSMENKFYINAKKLQIRHFKRNLKRVDCYVFLTEFMKEWFDWDIKYTVVEGISSKTRKDLGEPDQIQEKRKSILYAGMIEEKYGVVDLVKAFMKINDDKWTLELFGNGSSINKIKELSKKDPRVHLRGTAPNAQVLQEQKDVEILVNPRNDTQSFTKYSFPSKVIEYMGSGTPMIGYKLSGMPDEYKEYFYCVDNTQDGLYKTLKKTMELSTEERRKMGYKAQEFIVTKKTAVVQCSKIVEMLDEL